MIRQLFLIFACLLAVSCKHTSQEHFQVFIASNDPSDTVAIGVFEWAPSQKTLTPAKHFAELSAANYVAINRPSKRLYGIHPEGIFAASIGERGQLTLLNQIPPDGKGPCYISISNDKKHLLVAYYSSGNVCTYALSENGEVGRLISNVQHTGSSVNSARQKAPHPHMIYPVADSDLVLVPDLGIDKVMVYRIDDSGILSPQKSNAQISPGGGPRHLSIHPNGKFAYVLHELTGEITGFGFDKKEGFTSAFQTLSTLPERFDGYNKSADIHITPNGQYLYASNRGPNTIATFEIDQNSGLLTLKGIQDCGGEWPRAFAVDPSGQFIFVANKRSHQVSIMEIDYSTGLFNKVLEMPTPLEPQAIRFN